MLLLWFVGIFGSFTAFFELVTGDLTNYFLVQVFPKNESQIQTIIELDGLSERVNLLDEPKLHGPSYLYLDQTFSNSVTNELSKFDIPFSVKSKNLQGVIDNAMIEISLRKLLYSQQTSYDLQNFHTYSEIKEILQKMVKQHPNYAKYSIIGKSYESRDIPLLVLSKSPNTSKKIIVLECGMHAREWVSPATCLWIADDILNNNTHLLDQFDFHLFPTMNPDGYVTTWSLNRLWRKNRRPSSLWCTGIDLNRNFDAAYDRAPHSSPCSEIFHGNSAFSEPETAALRDHLSKFNDRLLFYFSLHSFSQMWMYPYGYKNTPPKTVGLIKYLADVASQAITDYGGKKYTFGQIYHVIYPAYGSSVDWAIDSTNAKLAYAIELRDNGEYGFLLPPDQIAPTAGEIWYAMQKVFAKYSQLKPSEIQSLSNSRLIKSF